ncbi:hypothetical protein KUCAC02_007204 [Chaenocephalus aceratus]|uniref:Uncharacterized protein n=1 Tax=Chaenocephalus aceratus TaxID=36190 RepID=A0ACB9X627_CHAAC|nr:hypothetical protein KUCAC02_007204 [Chaenocephalus aceratus]
MDADVESLHSARWVNAGTAEVFYIRSRLEHPNRNSFNDFLIDYSEEEKEGEDEAFGALESDVFPVEEVDLAVLLSDFRKEFVSDGLTLDDRSTNIHGNIRGKGCGTRRSCIKALDPSLYQLLCGQEPQLEQFDCSVLPDPDVQSRAKRILQCKTAEDLSDWTSECGVPGICSATIGDIPKIYASVVKHYIFLRTAQMVNQFTEGMNAFGNLWDLVRNNWIAFLPCFTDMRTPLTKSSFKAIFKYEYSPRGTHHQEQEEDTIYSWELVLNLIEDKLTELTFEDLLISVTGADEVPTLGFPHKPSIDLYTQGAGVRRLPYASTCADAVPTTRHHRGTRASRHTEAVIEDSWGFLQV